MTVEEFLQEKSQCVEAALENCLSNYSNAPPGLIAAMKYSLLAGGKRLRPALALGACELLGGKQSDAMPAACALEMVHTYSLIHDDLPCMDDDDLRRGKPTSHKKFNEATAILAGDGLLTMAFYELARTGRADAVAVLAEASGVGGMAGGQYHDMLSLGETCDIKDLQRIHACKTGALITASLHLGAIFADASSEQINALTGYGRHLGMLFQITDDILDVTGVSQLLGKSVGKDEQSSKATYPAVVGIEQARILAQEAAEAACDELSLFGEAAEIFHVLTRYILKRNR
ncbi:MAG: polyprenyl synthetase family protein [Candidatus Hydrogenedentes bacterium]|nr:polyprenyl synthetase family protein [Candidatus Hydrogenedentota bacterium]